MMNATQSRYAGARIFRGFSMSAANTKTWLKTNLETNDTQGVEVTLANLAAGQITGVYDRLLREAGFKAFEEFRNENSLNLVRSYYRNRPSSVAIRPNRMAAAGQPRAINVMTGSEGGGCCGVVSLQTVKTSAERDQLVHEMKSAFEARLPHLGTNRNLDMRRSVRVFVKYQLIAKFLRDLGPLGAEAVVVPKAVGAPLQLVCFPGWKVPSHGYLIGACHA